MMMPREISLQEGLQIPGPWLQMPLFGPPWSTTEPFNTRPVWTLRLKLRMKEPISAHLPHRSSSRNPQNRVIVR